MSVDATNDLGESVIDPFVEREGATERVRGRTEHVGLYSFEVVVLSQIRGERNPIADELKADILANDLQDPIEVCRVDEALLSKYIEFTNNVWESEFALEQFAEVQQPDGTYHLLTGGHTRLMVIQELELEFAGTDIFPVLPIEAKVHKVESIWDIIQKQSSENIHSTPSRERRAMALVEAYEAGKADGLWGSVEEYAGRTGASNNRMNSLQEAQFFSQLPEHVRNLVFQKALHYSAGVEIGKSVTLARQLVMAQHYGEVEVGNVKGKPKSVERTYEMLMADEAVSEEERQKIKTIVQGMLSELATAIMNDDQRSRYHTKAEAYIIGQRRLWRQLRQKYRGREHDLTLGFELKPSPDETLRNIRYRLNAQLRDIARRPGSRAATIVRECGSVLSPEDVEVLLGDIAEADEQARRAVGSRGLAGEALF